VALFRVLAKEQGTNDRFVKHATRWCSGKSAAQPAVWLFSANIFVDEEVRAVSAAVSVASSSMIRSACALGRHGDKNWCRRSRRKLNYLKVAAAATFLRSSLIHGPTAVACFSPRRNAITRHSQRYRSCRSPLFSSLSRKRVSMNCSGFAFRAVGSVFAKSSKAFFIPIILM